MTREEYRQVKEELAAAGLEAVDTTQPGRWWRSSSGDLYWVRPLSAGLLN